MFASRRSAGHARTHSALSTRISAVMVLGLLLAGCDEEPETKAEIVRPVVTMVVADLEAYRVEGYTGRAQAVREVNIGFEVQGRLISRPVDVGSTVAAGDVLATLEPDRYVARIRALEGERASLEATLSNAEKELARREQLRDRDVDPQSRVDDQIMVVDAVKAQLEAVDGALDAARLDLGYTELAAPFAGTITEVFAENFQNVLAKQPVLRLLDTSRIEMEVSVPEGLIALAPHVERIDVTFASLPDHVIPATISNIGTEASLTTRTYPVTIVMDQPADATIQPGMSGTARAQTKLPDDWSTGGFEVPKAAVLVSDDGAEGAVWVVDEAAGTVTRKAVTILSTAERTTRVTGLAPGDRVVTAGASLLSEGQKVRLMTEGGK